MTTAFGAPDYLRSTRYGGRIVLDAAQPQLSQTLLLFPGEGEGESPSQQVIRASAAQTWVFTWTAEAIGTLLFNPAIARIHMGAGGVQHVAEVNLLPSGSIQVPSTVSHIEVLWDPVLQPILAGTEQVEVRGTLQRGYTRGTATRCTLVGAAVAGGLPPAVVIPPYARDMNVLVTGLAPVAYDPAVRYNMSQGAAGLGIYEFSGPEADVARGNGRTFPVPGNATHVRVLTVPAAGTFGAFYNFRIEI